MSVELVPFNEDWSRRYSVERGRIMAALGPRAGRVEHVGSTSVPGLLAKPIIDVVLEVTDTRDESSYVPALEGAGYLLKLREPDWYEHRLFTRHLGDVNLHVFSTGCPEIDNMIRFRNQLRHDPEDRARYAAAKTALSRKKWRTVQDYADAKSEIVASIMAKTS